MRGIPTYGNGRRGARQGRRAAALRVLALGAVVALAACSSPSTAGSGAPSTAGVEQAGATTTPSAAPTATPTAPAPVVTVAGGAKLGYGKRVRLAVSGGSFTSVQVAAAKGATVLDGDIAPDGASWVSEEAPTPGASYVVAATVKDAVGQDRPAAAKFAVKTVPVDQKLGFTVTPEAGAKVGVAEPIVVQFFSAVTEKAAVEKRLAVDARTPSGESVVGSWHWLSDTQVDWRPKEFWTPGTKVSLNMRLGGVKAATGRYGRKDYAQTFTIGAKRLLKVDLTTHTAKLYHGSKLVGTWPTGGGKRGLETYSGTYTVLNKSQTIQMDSCSARITCDKKNPEYYDQEVFWATRITRSGTFVHAAPWDGLMGRANVSHGCVHLSTANARMFFEQAVPGDPVIVSRSGRGPQERIATKDPGLYPWNLSWKKWVAGSALA
jgi:lipoprotein-anchoring transpeptidase ErfK/SrfK